MEPQGKVNPWIFVALTGLVAVSLAVIALQQRTEKITARAELDQARLQIETAVNRAVAAQRVSIERIREVEQRERVLIGKLEECMKGMKR